MPMIMKTLSLDECDIKLDGIGTGRFVGYASTFNGIDTVKDTILPGAFDATLSEHGMPRMFYNHKWDFPIGRYAKAYPDSKGLLVEGELTPELSISNDVRAAMKHRTLDGLSIAGFVKKGDYSDAKAADGKWTGGRVIHKWSRLVEVSPVVFPADGEALIQSVKGEEMLAEVSELETVRDFERFLRDAGGLSKGVAAAIVTRAKAIFVPGEPDPDPEAKGLVEVHAIIERMAASVKT
jgi:HK97 family phage prohead protease